MVLSFSLVVAKLFPSLRTKQGNILAAHILLHGETGENYFFGSIWTQPGCIGALTTMSEAAVQRAVME